MQRRARRILSREGGIPSWLKFYLVLSPLFWGALGGIIILYIVQEMKLVEILK